MRRTLLHSPLALAGRPRRHRAGRRPSRPSSTKPTPPALPASMQGDWEYMVGGGAATFDCNDDGFPDLFLAGGSGPATFYRNASKQGGPLPSRPSIAGSN